MITPLLLSFGHTWPLGHSRGTHKNKAITAPDIFPRGKLLPMELNSIILQDHCDIFAILFEHLILSTCRVVAVMVINGHLGRSNRKADQQTQKRIRTLGLEGSTGHKNITDQIKDVVVLIIYSWIIFMICVKKKSEQDARRRKQIALSSGFHSAII